METSARDQEVALEWALEHLQNALDELKEKELPEPIRAVRAAVNVLVENLEHVRIESKLELYREAYGQSL